MSVIGDFPLTSGGGHECGFSVSVLQSPSTTFGFRRPTGTETGARARLERALGLQLQLGFASLTRRGYQVDATKSAFEYALALADRLGDTPMRHAVLYGLWVGMLVRSEHAEALLQAEALVHLAENSRDTATQVVAHRLAGTSLCLLGRLSEAQTRLDCASALYDPINHTGLESRFGQDVGTTIHTYLAINLAR